jgi:hypothetical protein
VIVQIPFQIIKIIIKMMNQGGGNPLVSMIIRPPRNTYPDDTGTTLTQSETLKTNKSSALSSLPSPSSSLKASHPHNDLALYIATAMLATRSRAC